MVYGLLRTVDAVSPEVSQGEVIASLTAYTALYAVLAAIEITLMVRAVRAGPSEPAPHELDPPTRIGGDHDDHDRPLAFSY